LFALSTCAYMVDTTRSILIWRVIFFSFFFIPTLFSRFHVNV
jgi:hypothetical protein